MESAKSSIDLQKMSALKCYEYQTPIISLEDALAEQLIQKLNVNSYQRKLRKHEMGTHIVRTPKHANIQITDELKITSQQRAKDSKECSRKIAERLHRIEDFKQKYMNASNFIASYEQIIKSWEEFEVNETEFVNRERKEIEETQENCKDLMLIIKDLKELGNECTAFYRDYKIYVDYMKSVKNKYPSMSFQDFQVYLEEEYAMKMEKGQQYEQYAQELKQTSESLKNLLEGPFKVCKNRVKEALDIFEAINDEDRLRKKLKNLLFEIQTSVENEERNHKAAFFGLDYLASMALNFLPKEMYKNIDKNTIYGKLLIIRLANDVQSEIYNEMKKDNF